MVLRGAGGVASRGASSGRPFCRRFSFRRLLLQTENCLFLLRRLKIEFLTFLPLVDPLGEGPFPPCLAGVPKAAVDEDIACVENPRLARLLVRCAVMVEAE